MKFLFFTHDIDYGGAAKSLLILVKELLLLNHSVQIVTFAYPNDGREIMPFYIQNNVEVFYFPWPWLTGKFKGFDPNITKKLEQRANNKHLLPIIQKMAKKADIVCFNGYASTSLATNINCSQKILIAREELDNTAATHKYIVKFLIKNITKAISTGPAESQQLAEMGIQYQQIFNSAQHVPELCPLPPAPLRFGVFSNIYPLKGQMTVVDACALFKDYLRSVGAQVYIYGQGSGVNMLKKSIHNQNVDDIVHYKGWVSNVEDVMREMHWIISPSRAGAPWGRDIIEAMSLGRPVLATGAEDCFIKNGHSGLLIPPMSAEILGKTLQDICTEDTTATYAKNAYDFATQEFNPQIQAEKFVKWTTGN